MVDDSRSAWGYGIATVSKTTGVVLDTWFPNPEVGAPPHNFDSHLLPAHISALEGEDALRDVNLQGVALAIELDTPPQSTTDAYLRLHLLSHTLTQPNTLNLDGIFPLFRAPLDVLVISQVAPHDDGRCKIARLDQGAQVVHGRLLLGPRVHCLRTTSAVPRT